ncbi:MAG: hypothetical protein WBA31_01270 [Candidatus Dormiibacterota bacterium]
MTQAEVSQPISGVPLRWSGFTSRQLSWLGLGLALPYLLVRGQVPLDLLILASVPWLGTFATLAFGRCEGRRLDAWIGDWVWFLAQPCHLHHPGSESRATQFTAYVAVDAAMPSGSLEAPPPTAASLPWVTS